MILSMPDTTLACTHCRLPMRPLRLAGHYGQQVDIDLCERCHLVWFDSLESVRLSGLGWLQMLRAMEAAHHVEHLRPEDKLGCARCGVQLKTVYNQTAFGRSTARECPKGHGQSQSFNLLLAERGLIRQLLPADLAAVRASGEPLCCVNCGGDVRSAREPECSWCGSAIALLDVARLVRALTPGVMLAGQAEREDAAGPARHMAWPCRGCGAPVDPGRDDACRGCGRPVLAPALGQVLPLLDGLEPQLSALSGRLHAGDAPALPVDLMRQRLDALEHSRVQVPWQDPPQADEPDLEAPAWRRYLPAALMLGLLCWMALGRR